MSTPKADQMKTANTVLIVLFVLIVWLPTIDSFLHIDKTPHLNENRAMATKPVFTGIANTKDYLSNLELYFNDHFGYRQALVRMQSKWKRKLFGEASVSEAMIGTDGWIYTTANRMIESYTGLSRFTSKNLADWQTLLQTRRAWLQKRGIAYVVVVTPDKHTIYPEHLPAWLKPAPGPTKLDQWIAHFREHSTLQPLDLRPLLFEAKKSRPVYMMTDTHWNGLGAFLCYQALIREISKQVPAVQPLPDDAFTLKPISGAKGDLAVLLGQENNFPELQANTLVPSPNLPVLKIEESMLHAGKKHVAITRTHNPQGNGTAIVFRDSFGIAWFPFIGLHFRDVIFLAQRDFDLTLIEKEKPVVVIDQIVERIVNTHDPVEMLERDGLKQ
ncbi:MAG: hypothetical protein QM715_06435 [Nibricoccus sp.]